jgi:hypothetical protein
MLKGGLIRADQRLTLLSFLAILIPVQGAAGADEAVGQVVGQQALSRLADFRGGQSF